MKSARALFPALVAIALGAECRAQAAGGNDTPPVDAGAQLLGIVGLAATPDITASRLEPAGAGDLDGQRIDTVRLANEVSLSFGDGDLYLEGNLGFARANVDLRLGDGVVEANRFDAVGAFGAIGPDLHLRRFLHVRPLLIIGAGYVDDDFGLPEALEDEAEATVDLRQWSLATGFGLSIDYERPVGVGSVDLRLKLSQVFFDTLWSADPRFAIDATNRTINTSAVYKHDTGLRIRSYPLLVTGLLGANAFLGDQRDALGFAWFGEYGGGLELDLSRADARVQRARVRVTGIAGDGVTGISLGVGVGF